MQEEEVPGGGEKVFELVGMTSFDPDNASSEIALGH